MVYLVEPVEIKADCPPGVDQWQLQRLSTRDLPLGDISERVEVPMSHIYILDTGVDCSHPDLRHLCSPLTSGHVGMENDFFCNCSEYSDWVIGPKCDCHGHGTHCAGDAAANGAGWNLWPEVHSVKVLNKNGSGSKAVTIAGIEWAGKHHKDNYSTTAGILNLSLGGALSDIQDEAINRAREDYNVLTVVSAGNSDVDACT